MLNRFGLMLFLFLGFCNNVLAADLINAETLSDTWYSTAEINVGDTININAGNRIIQIKITNIKDVAPKTPMEKVAGVANVVVNTGNQYAETLANYVESFKTTPIENKQDSARQDLADLAEINQNEVQGKVLSASIENIEEVIPVVKNSSNESPFYNPLIDVAVFLIHQWVWVLGGILLFIIFLKFT